ncbi:DeoR family transcriptional regulator [Thermohydrogenium kirishiense]|nr:DeoR family transcriptional regulator [Thermohydrogenium kirishiense]
MLAATRRGKIKEILMKKKSVKVSELCEMFQVSDETIRRDLEELEKEGLIERNYGGGVLKKNVIVPPLLFRMEENIEEKEKIANKALDEIKEGMSIFLDAGSTTYQVARAINFKCIKNITVITNGLNIAAELASNTDISLLVTGGNLKNVNYSLVGPDTVEYVRRYNVDTAFLATAGVSAEKGFTTSDIFEAEVKRSMLSSAKTAIVVVDSSKFGKDAMVSFCSIKDVDKVITSGDQNLDVIEDLKSHVNIVLV